MSLPEDPSEHSMPGTSTIFEAELALEAQTPPSLPALSPTSQDDDGLHDDEVSTSPPAQQWHFLTVARDLSTLTEEIVLRSPRLAFSIELLLPSEHSVPALGLNWNVAGALARAQTDDDAEGKQNAASIADHDATAAGEDAGEEERDDKTNVDDVEQVAENRAGEYWPVHGGTIDETACVDEMTRDSLPPQSDRVLRLLYVGEEEPITPGNESVYEVERDDGAYGPSPLGTLPSTSVAQSASDILDETRLSPTSPVLPELDESPSLTDAILSLPLLPRMFLKTTRSSSPHPDDGRVTHVATLPRLAQPQRPSSRPFIEQPPPSLRVSFPSSTFDDLLAFPNNASARAAAPARTRARTISARNRDRNREGASVLWTPRQEVNLPRTRRNTISTATPTERGARPTQRRVRFASHLPLPREVPPLRLGARGPLLVHPSEELVSLYGFCAFQNLDDCIL